MEDENLSSNKRWFSLRFGVNTWIVTHDFRA
jgi:hypothetical protein